VMRLTAAFDALVAPIWLALDNLDAYFDPALAPRDFVSMLAAWVGLPLDDNWRDEQSRRLVAQAIEMYRWRGTCRGLTALIEAYTGVTPTITESGGTSWSPVPGGVPPGTTNPAVHVRLELGPGAVEDLVRLTRLIAENVPAHVAINVEIVRSES